MFRVLKKQKNFSLIAPVTGETIKIDQVPDNVFAKKLLGDGIAINPKEGIIIAPCDGKIIQASPTRHAISIEAFGKIELLIHIGIDTVSLGGKGFKSFRKVGDHVKQGDKLLEIDLHYIREQGLVAISPIVITNMGVIKKLTSIEGGETVKGGKDKIMDIVVK